MYCSLSSLNFFSTFSARTNFTHTFSLFITFFSGSKPSHALASGRCSGKPARRLLCGPRVRIDSETAGVLSLGIDHFENVLASMGNQQEDVMRKVAELNSEREQANLRILGGAVPPPPPPPRNPPALQNVVVVETGKQ